MRARVERVKSEHSVNPAFVGHALALEVDVHADKRRIVAFQTERKREVLIVEYAVNARCRNGELVAHAKRFVDRRRFYAALVDNKLIGNACSVRLVGVVPGIVVVL